MDIKLSAYLLQSQKVVETHDDFDNTARTFASNMALSEEVNGTADDAEDHDAEYRSESRGVEDEEEENEENEIDEDYQQPGETSVGKKLWKFLTT